MVETPSTNRVKNEYLKLFSSPLEFWTSEDGMLLSLVVLPTAEASLREHYIFQQEAFDPSRIKHRYAFKEWVGVEFFDGGSGQRSGKVWRVGDAATDFPVLEYELKIPR